MGKDQKSVTIDVGEKLSERELCPDNLLKGQEEAFARDIQRLQRRIAEFVQVACPACGSESYHFAFEKFRFSYVVCEQCETLFMNPRPSPEIMDFYYQDSENYRYWAKYIFPASEASRREKIHKLWLERIVEYCDRYNISKDTIMEVGGGFGTFGSLVQESKEFKRVVAVEPTPEMVQACRNKGLEVIDKRIEDLTGEIESADIIVSFEVIEHLYDPGGFLKQCSKILRSGGLLVLSCPNGKGFDISVLGKESLAVDPEHVNFFNPDSLRILVESCSFLVKEVTTPGRLDAEFVRTAIREGKLDISNNPFFKRVFFDEWDKLGWPFQIFLAENDLSSHMWLAAIKK